MQVVLAASGTVAGAEVYGSIMDTATFLGGMICRPLYAMLYLGTVTDQEAITDWIHVCLL